MSIYPASGSNVTAPAVSTAIDATAAQKLRRGVIRRLIRHSRAQFPVCLVGLVLVAAIIRVTVQDRLPGLAMLYYATPPAILAMLLFGAGGIWLIRRRWQLAIGCLLAASACALWWQQTTWFHHPPAAIAEDDIRILCWNTARGWCGWEPAALEIQRQDADLIGLVEAGYHATAMANHWHQYLPNYNIFTFDTGIAILSRFPARPVARGSLAQRGRYEHCAVQIRDKTVHLIVVDLRGEPLHSRRPPLEALSAVLAPLSDQRVIVMGDFNTPTDSVYFHDLRRSYINAFETAGTGNVATWPALAPVLTIDHIWTTPGVKVRQCDHAAARPSDHRWVKARIAIE